MLNSDLDYKLGWRWLLPIDEEDRIFFYGFSNEEKDFFRKLTSESSWMISSENATILIINATNHDGISQISCISEKKNICVLANRTHAPYWYAFLNSKYPNIKEYSLLPSKKPRIIIPLSSSNDMITALNLYHPGRLVARLAKVVAKMFAYVGNSYLLRSKILIIASRSDSIIPQGLDSTCTHAKQINYALYLGTPEDNRKTVVLPLTDTLPDTIIKVAENHTSYKSLKNEIETLITLNTTSIHSFIPKVKKVITSPSRLILYQEYRPSKSRHSKDFTEAVIYFLGQLTLQNGHWGLLSHVLKDLKNDDHQLSNEHKLIYKKLHTRLEQIGKANTKIWLHRNHGDFSPWNCSWTNKGFFVFDWEKSQQNSVALGDAFYYILAPIVLVKSMKTPNIKNILARTLNFAEHVVKVSELPLDSKIYLALWLLTETSRQQLYIDLATMLEREW